MSDEIFPKLIGISWDITKTPEFYTISKTSPSGVDVVASLSGYPRWNFTLSYEFLRDTGTDGELQKLVGFFLQRRGNVQDFLLLDDTDHIIENPQNIGVGDGKTTEFQLIRNYGGFIEPVFGTVSGTVHIFGGGIEITDGVTINAKGLVTFATAPTSGTVLSWTGEFYYRVRFKESSVEFSNFAYKLWEAKTVELVSVKRLLV